MASKDNRSYYDEFAKVYENERHDGYHRLLDELEFSVLEPYAKGARVLEAGCGTGLILARAAQVASEACGVDLSPGMLELARSRGLNVQEANVTALPFPDNSFDVVYSFKVLAHVAEIKTAMVEMARVVKPGGHLLLEFYNPTSLRGLIKKLKPATAIREGTDDHQVYTRYDRLSDVLSYAPPTLDYVARHGLRIVSPTAHVYRLKPAAKLLGALEHGLKSGPLAGFGGFLVVVFRKR